MKNKICLLGLRGSIPVSGEEFNEFGGATSCMVVYGEPEAGEKEPEHAIVIDAGTGLLNLRKYVPNSIKRLTILLSHIHLDHIQGLLMLPEMFTGAWDIEIYCGKHCGESFKDALNEMMKPPIWPVTPKYYSKNVHFLDLPEQDFEVGKVTISSMPGAHPNDINIFKFTFPNGTTLVHVGDYEVGTDAKIDEKLKDFAHDTSLLLMDGMYTMTEYEKQRGFGHSPWEMTAELADKVGVQRLRIIHHAPNHDDKVLREAEEHIKAKYPGAAMGREGEILEL